MLVLQTDDYVGYWGTFGEWNLKGQQHTSVIPDLNMDLAKLAIEGHRSSLIICEGTDIEKCINEGRNKGESRNWKWKW